MLLNQTESRCRGCYARFWPPAPSESPPSRFQSPAIRKVDPCGVSVMAVQCFESSAFALGTSAKSSPRISCRRFWTNSSISWSRASSPRPSAARSSSLMLSSSLSRFPNSREKTPGRNCLRRCDRVSVGQQPVDCQFGSCGHVDLAVGHRGHGEFDGVARAIARGLGAIPKFRAHVACVIGMQGRGAATG
jgi:hypothetical protein